MRKFFLVLFSLGILSCASVEQREKVDLLVFNANVYTVNNAFSQAEAFAVKDGVFVEIGNSKTLKQKYKAKETLNAQGKTIVPGLIDAHAHLYGFGLQLQKVNLTNTHSFNEVVERIVDFQKEKNSKFITGMGWDQNDWEIKEFPTKDTLDILFPKTPVVISRIDGHAVLVNQAALKTAGITTETPDTGGSIEKKNGKLTGIIVDKPIELIQKIIPEPTQEEKINALLDAQKIVFDYGLTTVADAGIERETIELIDSLQKADELDVRIYAMISYSDENLDYYLNRDIYKTEKLNVRSFKFYGDGALGSRGAALKEPYSDMHNHYGALLASVEEFKAAAKRIAASNYQMNTHAIGDSANVLVLKTYDSLISTEEDRRWRVEHAQIIDETDFQYFSKNIIPSVQPTHATSDMYWVENRLGKERLKGAYAYKKLLNQAGIIVLGTDFPVEQVNPFLTFYAALTRKDVQGAPKNGFMKEQALTRKVILKGMTIWAAFANFEEHEKGSIETGKLADFVILNQDIMKVSEVQIPETKAIATYIGGKKVK